MPQPSSETAARLLRNLFVGRWDTYTVAKEDGHYIVAMDRKKEKLPLSDVELLAHCEGKITVAPYIVDGDGKTSVGVIDIDSKQEPARQIVTFARAWLEHHGIPAFAEPSGRRGYHIWIILKGRISAAKIKRLLNCLVADWIKAWEAWAQKEQKLYPFEVNVPPIKPPKVAGPILKDYQGNEVHLPFLIEVNPKTVEPTTLATPGNGIKLPWGRHRVTGKWTAFINNDWTHYPDWGIDAISRAAVVTEDAVAQVLSKYPEEEGARRPAPSAGDKPKTYGLPCFAKMMDGVAEGFRHKASLRLAVQLYRQGISEERATSIMLDWDGANSPSLGKREILSSIKSAYSGKYKLGCADIQAAGFCDKSCPVYNKMYLERDSKVEAESADIIEHIIKVTTEPPTYRVLVQGHWIGMSLEELFRVSFFKKKVMATADFVPHIGMKQQDWERLITQRLAQKEIDVAPEDARDEDEVLAAVYDWLQNTPYAESYADVMSGRPLLREGCYHFRGNDVKTMLRHRRIQINQSQLWTIIHAAGGFSSTLRLEDHVLRLWRLPVRMGESAPEEGEGEVSPEGHTADIEF